mmetsp:Transcript_93580/g.235796  ORF Transcript_93580/g.235796 Transcript_93580/m.235796 type:complete len:754 (-) Transcript_93580:23-2284(-)
MNAVDEVQCILPIGYHLGDIVRYQRSRCDDSELAVVICGCGNGQAVLVEDWFGLKRRVPMAQLQKVEPPHRCRKWPHHSRVVYHGDIHIKCASPGVVGYIVGYPPFAEDVVSVQFPGNEYPKCCSFGSLSVVPPDKAAGSMWLEVGDLVEALEGQQYERHGVEYYRAGDTGTVAGFSTLGVEIVWARSGKVTMVANRTGVRPGSNFFKRVQNQTLHIHDEVQALPQTRIDDVCRPGDRGFVKEFVASGGVESVIILWQSGQTHAFRMDRWMDSFWRTRERSRKRSNPREFAGDMHCQVTYAFTGEILLPDLRVSRGILALEMKGAIARASSIAVEEQELLMESRALDDGEEVLFGQSAHVAIQLLRKPPRIVAWLESASWEERKKAVDVLGARGDAERFVPQIVRMVDDAKFEVRSAIVAALSRPALRDVAIDMFRTIERSALQMLLGCLEHGESKVWEAAAELLRAFMPGKGPHLVLLTSSNGAVRAAALQDLERFGFDMLPHAAQVVGMLRDDDLGVVSAAKHAISAFHAQSSDKAIWEGELAMLLANGDRALHKRVLHCLAEFSGDGFQLAALLTHAGQPKYMRVQVMELLGEMGERASPHVALLAEGLRDRNGEVRLAAVQALTKSGASSHLLANLPALLADGDRDVRSEAVQLASALGKPALPKVTRALKAEDSRSRCAAARALRAMGPIAAPAVRQLQELLLDEDQAVQEAVRRALEAVGGPSAEEHREPEPGTIKRRWGKGRASLQ